MKGGFQAGAGAVQWRSAELHQEASTALPTPACSSSGAPSVSRRTYSFDKLGWEPVTATEIGEATRGRESRTVLVRWTEAWRQMKSETTFARGSYCSGVAVDGFKI
ncbi:hypothetical protein AAHE18_15G218900 [Arachis hypogaea]